MPEPAVWMCFGKQLSEKLKPSDKAWSSEVVNLKPIKPANFREMDSTANAFSEFLELSKIFVPWKFTYSKIGVQLR